jgi:bifunctional non-homologous end joining protein LigD
VVLRPGLSDTWHKIKGRLERAFVVGGYTIPAEHGTTTHVGGVLVGFYDGKRLMFAGGVGFGVPGVESQALRKSFELIPRSTSPFANDVVLEEGRDRVRWVEPRVVVQVAFAEWTSDGRLRHPSYKGVRLDKDPREVVREPYP